MRTVRMFLTGAWVTMLLAGSIATVAAQYGGWFIPVGGRDEKSPVSSVPGAVTRGKAVFFSKCARCHGAEGKGNGSDSDHAADLTDEYRDTINPEGVLSTRCGTATRFNCARKWTTCRPSGTGCPATRSGRSWNT